jgi:PadR family transcriptional regulator AphA
MSGGKLGRVWRIPKAVVYRAISRLLDAGLIAPEATEPGFGPQRTVYTATPGGLAAAGRWLAQPVAHVRDIRSELLLKLALLDRAGADPVPLLRAQRAVLEPIVAAIESRQPRSSGFDATLLAWRRASAVAALDFLDVITTGLPSRVSPQSRTGFLSGGRPPGAMRAALGADRIDSHGVRKARRRNPAAHARARRVAGP